MDRKTRDRLIKSYATEMARAIRKEQRIAEIESELAVLRGTATLHVPTEWLDVAAAHVWRAAVGIATANVVVKDEKQPDAARPVGRNVFAMTLDGVTRDYRGGGGTETGRRKLSKNEGEQAMASRGFASKPIKRESTPKRCERCVKNAPALRAPMPVTGDNGRRLIERQWACADCYRAAILDDDPNV